MPQCIWLRVQSTRHVSYKLLSATMFIIQNVRNSSSYDVDHHQNRRICIRWLRGCKFCYRSTTEGDGRDFVFACIIKMLFAWKCVTQAKHIFFAIKCEGEFCFFVMVGLLVRFALVYLDLKLCVAFCIS